MTTTRRDVLGRSTAFVASVALVVFGVAAPANAEVPEQHCLVLLDGDQVQVCADTFDEADRAFAQATGLTRVESPDIVGDRVTYTLAKLYADAGYGGSSTTLLRSTPCDGVTLSGNADLSTAGLNDAVSSFVTYSTCTVRLYSDPGYTGSSYGYTTSQSSLPTFNDVASSARAR